MKTTAPRPSLLLTLVLLVSCGSPDTGSPSQVGPVGFSGAYFDALTLTEMMRDDACHAVRVYDARRTADDRVGTAMAIGINKEGEELNGWFFEHRYKLFLELGDEVAKVEGLTRGAAATACQYVRDARDSSYVAEFPRQDVERLLAADGCNGVAVVPEDWREGYYTMRMIAVTISNGGAVEVPDVGSLLCSDPCPTFCGRRRNYVN